MSDNFTKINKGINLPPQSTPPSNPTNGDFYYDSTVNALKIYENGTWLIIGASVTNPMTTTGDIIYSSDNSGTPTRLGIGAEGDVLQVASGLPTWVAIGPGGSDRGLFAGGYDGSTALNSIEYIAISTTGNAADFGDLTVARYWHAASSSNSRAVFNNGNAGGNVIDYVTIATAGNATDFGDLTIARYESAACSNQTRCLFAGGYDGSFYNTIDYITIASIGNATDFGDLTSTAIDFRGCSSPTRGVFGSHFSGTSYASDYVTIATTGNASSFGTLTAYYLASALSSDTRGIFAGGFNSGSAVINTIEYITIATTGNGTSFGNLSSASASGMSTSNNIRGVIALGYTGSYVTTIDYITIDTTGNSTTFGDLITSHYYGAATSGNHGGLQ